MSFKFGYQIQKGQKKNKYKNKKVFLNGIEFDSKKEANRYKELKLLEMAGKITNLQLQPKFELIPTIRKDWLPRTIAVTNYKADFMYTETETGNSIVEDVKGFKTDTYQLKKKMFIHLYGEQHIFRET